MNFKQFREKLKWLDPFTYVDIYVMPKVNPNENEALSWVVYLASAFFFAWLIYSALGLALGTASPMMIVVSGSMEPLYHRGDVVVLQGTNAEGLAGPEFEMQLPSLAKTALSEFAKPVYSNGKQIEGIEFNSGETIPVTKEGSIVVYWSDYLSEPIIHRVVAKLHAADGLYVLTKGDSLHNNTVDQDCGSVINGRPERPCIELYPVPLEKLHGKALFHVPFLGCVKLWILDDLGSLIATGRMPSQFQAGNVC